MDTQSETKSEKSPSNRFKKGLLLIGLASVVGLGAGVFAANINIPNDGVVEFGTGTSVISTCVTSAAVNVTTEFVPGSSSYFKLDKVIVDDLVHTCVDDEIKMSVDVMRTSGVSLLAATPEFTISATPTITADFNSENLDSDDVGYVLLETSDN
jgi:hypothetical protein